MAIRVIALCALLCRAAYAQNAEAEALFNEGDKLMAQGKLAQACDSFEASNRIEARAGTLIRLGQCREQNHQLASAWSAYKDALVRVKDPKKQKIATAKVAELEPKLSHLTITVSHPVEGLTLTRNGKPIDPAVWNRALPIDGGDYVIVAQAPGHREWRKTVKVPVEEGDVAISAPALAVVETAAPAPPPPVEQPRPATTFTTKRKVAVAVGALGGAALIAGAVLGVSAKSQEDEAFTLCPDPQQACADADRANSLIDSAHGRALAANISFGVGGAAVIAAAVLWLTGAPESPRVSAIPQRDGAALVVTGRF